MQFKEIRLFTGRRRAEKGGDWIWRNRQELSGIIHPFALWTFFLFFYQVKHVVGQSPKNYSIDTVCSHLKSQMLPTTSFAQIRWGGGMMKNKRHEL